MNKILEGLRDAARNDFASVTIEGVTYVRVGHEATEHQLSLARQTIAELQQKIDVQADQIDTLEDELQRAGS